MYIRADIVNFLEEGYEILYQSLVISGKLKLIFNIQGGGAISPSDFLGRVSPPCTPLASKTLTPSSKNRSKLKSFMHISNPIFDLHGL